MLNEQLQFDSTTSTKWIFLSILLYNQAVKEAVATVKLYIQQQWDPRMLSLAFEV